MLSANSILKHSGDFADGGVLRRVYEMERSSVTVGTCCIGLSKFLVRGHLTYRVYCVLD
jgi:hypothetical protein